MHGLFNLVLNEWSETILLDFYKKYYKTIFDISLIILTVLLIMWIFSYLYHIAAPIFISVIIFYIIEPLSKFFNKRGIKKSIATALAMLIFIIILSGVLVGAGMLIVTQADTLSKKITENTFQLQAQIENLTHYIQDQIELIPDHVIPRITEYLTTLAGKLGQWAGSFLGWLAGFLSSFTAFMVHFILGFILAYFLSVEIDNWKMLASKKTPRTFKKAYFFLKENVFEGIIGYIKAQAILITITFFVILISLLLLRVENAFTISVIAAVLDVLPVLGVSTLFVPWIIYLFFVGKNTLAIWLLILLVIIVALRQILEPKIVGDSLGVSAFTMLAFMIISLSLFGVAGLILSPILIILLKSLYEQGYLKRWIRAPEDY